MFIFEVWLCLIYLCTLHVYTFGGFKIRYQLFIMNRGTGTSKVKDEVNRRDICEYDGCVCVVEVIGDPSKLRVIRKTAVLTRIRSTLDLS